MSNTVAAENRRGGPEAAPSHLAENADAGSRTQAAPRLDAIERQRLALKRQYTRRLLIAGTGAVCAIGLFIVIYPHLRGPGGYVDKSLLVLPLSIVAVLGFWSDLPRRRFEREFKKTVPPLIAESFGGFSYEHQGGISLSRIQDSTLIPPHHNYHPEDLFTGVYRDVSVEFCEARFTKRGADRKADLVFSGLFVLLTMNKNFRGTTVVRRDAGKLRNWLKGAPDGLEPVKLEDPEFEEQFEVYSDDQVEARYLLTPAFMSRLLELCRALGTDRMETAFCGSQLAIRLPSPGRRKGSPLSFGLNLRSDTGPLFEPGWLLTSSSTHDMSRRIADEFRLILSIVDMLKLHERTGL